MPSITTALIYTRVSSDEQAREGISLDAQLSECRRYATTQGWALGGEYQDILSGKRDDRPGYQALLTAVRRLRAEGRSVSVVVAYLARFGRRVLERVRCREELKGLGVSVHSAREGGLVSDLVSNILASVAEEEVAELGRRVSAAKQHIRQQGYWPGAKAPWGYRIRPATEAERRVGAPQCMLELDPVTAPYVREVYTRIAHGESLRRAATWVRGLPDHARGGRELNYTTVRRLVLSPVYIARPANSTSDDVLSVPAGHWPALIDEATWAAAKAAIAGHQRVPRQASGGYLLTGWLRCARCGTRMGGSRMKGHQAYQCESHTRGASLARCRYTVQARFVDEPVLAEVRTLVETVAVLDTRMQAELDRAWSEWQRTVVGDDGAERERELERVIERARQRITNAATLFADAELDKIGYEGLRDREMASFVSATEELERLRTRVRASPLPPLGTVLAELGAWSAALDGAEVPALRRVLAAVLERVTPRRLSFGKYQIEMAWTPAGQALRELVSGARGEQAA